MKSMLIATLLLFSFGLNAQTLSLDEVMIEVTGRDALEVDSIMFHTISSSVDHLDSLPPDNSERFTPLYLFTINEEEILGQEVEEEFDSNHYYLPFNMSFKPADASLPFDMLLFSSSNVERSYLESKEQHTYTYDEIAKAYELDSNLYKHSYAQPYQIVQGRNHPMNVIHVPHLSSDYLIIRRCHSYPDGNQTSFYRESILIFERRHD